jgi:hypothetical protein
MITLQVLFHARRITELIPLEDPEMQAVHPGTETTCGEPGLQAGSNHEQMQRPSPVLRRPRMRTEASHRGVLA